MIYVDSGCPCRRSKPKAWYHCGLCHINFKDEDSLKAHWMEGDVSEVLDTELQ